ncbi:hypothetical protein [Amycolatopsis sp. NPDC059657]|uniref:hypothetical protein n=1 Tax=Amycolatopsis sp. NPDC059657 TaxID=3346899 RepID=UPI00366BB18E
MKLLSSARLDRDLRKKSRAGLTLLGALGVLTASVLVLPGQAAAAVRCDAPQGQSCLKIVNSHPLVGSVRVGGAPVSNVGYTKLAVPSIKVAADSARGNPAVLLYNDRNCQDGLSQSSAGIGWAAKPDNDNFRSVYITFGSAAG